MTRWLATLFAVVLGTLVMFPNENISAQTSDLDTDAVTLTGLMYVEGRGVDENIRKAVRLFRSSANEDGCGKARRVLAALTGGIA